MTDDIPTTSIRTTNVNTGGDPKRARILEGAMTVFLAYGFARTTMDDIARAAEVSRPALYLQFKNKTDIYRAIGNSLLEDSVATARAGLEGEGGFAERMAAAIDDAVIAMMARIVKSQHGAELLDMKNSLAADLIQSWREGLGAHFASAIAHEAGENGVDLVARGISAATLSDLLLDGLEGMKMRTSDVDEQRRVARGLVRVVELAIRP